MVAMLEPAQGFGWNVVTYNGGVGGATVATAAADIAAILAGISPAETVSDVLCNWGVNEMGFDGNPMPDETTWKTNYLTILDAVHAKWAAAKVRLTKPWGAGRNNNADTMAGWIDAVVASRPAFAVVGDDERAWFKPNVATLSTDGVHYSTPAGMAAKATAVKAALGY